MNQKYLKKQQNFIVMSIKGKNTFKQKIKELDNLIDSIYKEINLKVEGKVLKEK